uniref:Uncharacterized protein n=1 Tax=Clastoptera arizonana TaxID=38151 RepID=A0A1B6CF23_9HEMI
MIEFRVHKLREKRDGLVTVSFDCQKNMVLPKVPDQAAYYSRQLYTYNFTIFVGASNDKMTVKNTFIYTWNENDFPKGSNEICSSEFHCLGSLDLKGCTTIRLCAEGCGGQNRNSTMIAMCCYFLWNIAPDHVNQVELVFPIPGHSFFYLPIECLVG